ncbi:hypothetical protein J9B83_04680 [Marinomonas sp. A79]|uniref:Dimethylamine monooxygenase subunit DmmA-like C-terminal domain-containing protein n=1 Tax=Marinomonas vulgaris TaxID=2823372 RepID=A0ABS5H963_9GAMM|nr:dimethylamine monooxygenase subunit DmmA family protein [Marinomonas vulgaris]MBR7888231.1 hypothetical protein [Marinomonas vulgaris]
MQSEAPSAVTSRPVYAPIIIDSCSDNDVFICENLMSEQMQSLYLKSKCPAKTALCITSDDTDIAVDGVAEKPIKFQKISDFLGSLPSLVKPMTLRSRVYLEGSEPFMWRLYGMFLAQGMVAEQINMQSPVSNKRSLFCTHCFSVTDDVTTTVAPCSGCGRLLHVSDHFSKRHAAYFCYQVNAEDPNDVPQVQELT